MKRLLGSGMVLAAVAIAAPAAAQEDIYVRDPRIAYPFMGLHAEVLGGVDHLKGASGGGDTGIAYGGNIGYDFAAGSLILGVEGEATGATTRECDRDVLSLGDRLCLRAGRDLYAGGRVGIVTGNALLYAKAGYTNGRATLRYDGTTPGSSFTLGDNLNGVRVGAGVELDLGKLLVKAEYRYSNYEQDVSRHQGIVGVGTRF